MDGPKHSSQLVMRRRHICFVKADEWDLPHLEDLSLMELHFKASDK